MIDMLRRFNIVEEMLVDHSPSGRGNRRKKIGGTCRRTAGDSSRPLVIPVILDCLYVFRRNTIEKSWLVKQWVANTAVTPNQAA